MRGNQIDTWSGELRLASIPAYSGEPHRRGGGGRLLGVYPRVCGGTAETTILLPDSRRLSPRMRGNPAADDAAAAIDTSIPAYAGEPRG